MLVFAELSTTLMPVISAMPTISAAAVIAVRRGLRAELRLPSMPGIDQPNRPPERADDRPADGRREHRDADERDADARDDQHQRVAAGAGQADAEQRGADREDRPRRSTVIRVSGRSGVAASRIAAIGAIREARERRQQRRDHRDR